jgi:hypothetical protein
MRHRTLLLTAAATAALTLTPWAAQAQSAELVDRAMFDPTVEQTAGSLHLAAATRGELGGFLDVTVTAADGTLPTGSNVCEPGVLDAVLTVQPGETLSARVPGDLCTGFSGDSITANGGITKADLQYAGTAHRKAKLVGEGLVAVGVQSFGGQASFSASLRW